MKTYRQNLGAWGESQAADYLTGQGYIILEKNVRTPFGEIDLIGLAPTYLPESTPDGSQSSQGVLVFVEVKTRRSTSFGMPESAVTERKKAHLLAAVQAYTQDHPDLPGAWRIDVVSVQKARDGESTEITHFENAFS